MSDEKGDRIKHIHSNLYQICSPEKEPKIPHPYSGLRQSSILKKGMFLDTHLSEKLGIKVEAYKASAIEGRRVDRPKDLPGAPVFNQTQAMEDLKGNLKNLQDLQMRLKFLLKELEQWVD